MKKYLLNPHVLLMGFFLLIIVGSSPAVKAQEEKKIIRSIIITNGDTIVNGKKLSEVKKEERAKLRKEIQDMNEGVESSENTVIIKKGKSKEPLVLEWNDNPDKDGKDSKLPKQPDVRFFKFNGKDIKIDSLLDGFGFKMDGLDSNLKDRIITMRRNFSPGNPELGYRIRPEGPALKGQMPNREPRKNSSQFNYNYTDQDGIPSRMSIRISEVEKENIEKLTGLKEGTADLKIEDLTFFPNFSSGKLGISFNTGSNASLKVKILNSEFKQIFADDVAVVGGNYTKQITLPKNGIYYIAIKQNNNWFLRKFIKS